MSVHEAELTHGGGDGEESVLRLEKQNTRDFGHGHFEEVTHPAAFRLRA